MKKLASTILLIVIAVAALAQPKYVFYFIGDGMGANQVQLTEMYRASVEGQLGVKPLAFTQFPVATMATHYSASSDVTDSAASGTALATGTKTSNGSLGVDKDGNKLTNLAEMAKRSGKKVAIMTTVPVNHATPGAFEAHQKNRNMYYEICEDMIANGFDFYAGSSILNEEKYYDKTPAEPIRGKFQAAGYTICRNLADFEANSPTAQKILFVPDGANAMTYRMDALADKAEKNMDRVRLKDFVQSALSFLTKDKKDNGFFMMVEGGEIDHACHSHDAANTISEIEDFDEAIQVAIEFYNKYPKQTLIVVTADHETGGIILNPKTENDLAKLKYQRYSMNRISDNLKQMIRESNRPISWEDIRTFLSDNLGLFSEVKVNWEQEKELRDVYENTIAKNQAGSAKDLYADNAAIVSVAIKVLDNCSHVYWQCSHSACYVPVFAIGNGCEQFSHKTDNAELPMIIKSIAKYR